MVLLCPDYSRFHQYNLFKANRPVDLLWMLSHTHGAVSIQAWCQDTQQKGKGMHVGGLTCQGPGTRAQATSAWGLTSVPTRKSNFAWRGQLPRRLTSSMFARAAITDFPHISGGQKWEIIGGTGFFWDLSPWLADGWLRSVCSHGRPLFCFVFYVSWALLVMTRACPKDLIYFHYLFKYPVSQYRHIQKY